MPHLVNMFSNTDLPKLILIYAGVVGSFTLLFAAVKEENLADKAIGIFGNIALSSITGVLGYLTAQVEEGKDKIELDKLRKENDRLKKGLTEVQ